MSIMQLSDVYAFHMPGSTQSDQARTAMQATVDTKGCADINLDESPSVREAIDAAMKGQK